MIRLRPGANGTGTFPFCVGKNKTAPEGTHVAGEISKTAPESTRVVGGKRKTAPESAHVLGGNEETMLEFIIS